MKRVLFSLVLACTMLRCTSEQTPFEAMGQSLVDAIRLSDEGAFVRMYVQNGDRTPSGNYYIVTKAGGMRPDAAWNSEVRRAFADLSQRLTDSRAEIASLKLVKVEAVDSYSIDGDRDRSGFTNLKLRVSDGRGEYLLTIPQGMLASRGYVITGETNVGLAVAR